MSTSLSLNYFLWIVRGEALRDGRSPKIIFFALEWKDIIIIQLSQFRYREDSLKIVQNFPPL